MSNNTYVVDSAAETALREELVKLTMDFANEVNEILEAQRKELYALRAKRQASKGQKSNDCPDATLP